MSVRALLVTAALAIGIGAAAAQTPPATPSPAPPRPGNANLRAIPDGPGKRVAELQGLDKVTARTQRFYAPVGEATRFGTLEITVGDCLVNVPEAPPEFGGLPHDRRPQAWPGREKLFAGWMFASTPSLSALDHGVYDVRVLSCTMAQGSAPPSSR